MKVKCTFSSTGPEWPGFTFTEMEWLGSINCKVWSGQRVGLPAQWSGRRLTCTDLEWSESRFTCTVVREKVNLYRSGVVRG